MSGDGNTSKSSTSSRSLSSFLDGTQSIEDLEELKQILLEEKEQLAEVLRNLHLEASNDDKKTNCPVFEDANEIIEDEKKKLYHCLERELFQENKNSENLFFDLTILGNDQYAMLLLGKRLLMEAEEQKDAVKNLTEEIKQKNDTCTKLRRHLEELRLFGENLMTSENKNSERELLQELQEVSLKVNRKFLDLKSKLRSVLSDNFYDSTFKDAIAELYEAQDQSGENQYVEIVNYINIPLLADLFQRGIIEKHPYDENKVKLANFE